MYGEFISEAEGLDPRSRVREMRGMWMDACFC